MTSDRRARLIEAARRLFVQRGFRAAGIDAILELAGVAKMTLYNHFGSKDALTREVLNHHDVEERARYQRRMQRGGSPRAAVLAAFDQLAEEVASATFDGGLFLRAAYELAADREVYRVAAAEHRARQAALFTPLLLALGSTAAAQHAETLATLLDMARMSAFACGDKDAATKARALAELILDNASA